MVGFEYRQSVRHPFELAVMVKAQDMRGPVCRRIGDAEVIQIDAVRDVAHIGRAESPPDVFEPLGDHYLP